MDYEEMTDLEVNTAVAELMPYYSEVEDGCVWFVQPPSTSTESAHDGLGFQDTTSTKIWAIEFNPCENIHDAWPIILENKIDIINTGDTWTCSTKTDRRYGMARDKNPQRAAMIVFLKMKDL